jgi:thymidylate synthase (FAD)
MPEVMLIAVSKGAGALEGRSAEEVITYAARVSSDKGDVERLQTAERLLNHCLKNGHVSVFETASMTLEVTTSRAIAEQLIRHRSFTFQVRSYRYSECHSNEKYEARRQDPKNRKASVGDLPADTQEWFAAAQAGVNRTCQLAYDEALSKGVARECARFLLPLSATESRVHDGKLSVVHPLHLDADRNWNPSPDPSRSPHRPKSSVSWECKSFELLRETAQAFQTGEEIRQKLSHIKI